MRRFNIVVLLLAIALTGWACRELSHEEKVARARARYEVTLNGFFTQDGPAQEAQDAAADAVAEGEAEAMAVAVETAASEEGMDEEGMDEEMPGPEPRLDVLLDLLVQHDLDEALPGITVDIVMVDPDKNEKDSWRVWVETAGLPEANLKQVTHILEGVDYEEGDAFSVEIRSSVPAADYADYREFSEAEG